MTEPTTAAGPDSKAGRAMLDMLYNPDCSWSERMVIRAILAIEAEARQQDASGLRTALERLAEAAQEYFDRSPLTDNPDDLPPERREFATAFWTARHALAAALAALPPSAPPTLDVERLALSLEPVTRAAWSTEPKESQEQWRSRTAAAIAAEYARLTEGADHD